MEDAVPYASKARSRESRFVAGATAKSSLRQTRTPDEGDVTAHRRGGLTPYRGKGSAGRPESFMDYPG